VNQPHPVSRETHAQVHALNTEHRHLHRYIHALATGVET
jgi:hypothetical protein